MEQFKEKLWVLVVREIGLYLTIVTFVSFFGGFIFDSSLLWGVLMVIPALICLFIHFIAETKTDYTKRFLRYIEDKMHECKTYKDFQELRTEFCSLASKKGMWKLSFPRRLYEMDLQICAKRDLAYAIEESTKQH